MSKQEKNKDPVRAAGAESRQPREPQFRFRRGTEVPTTTLRLGEVPIIRKLVKPAPLSKRTLAAMAIREMDDDGAPMYPEDIGEVVRHSVAEGNLRFQKIKRGPAAGSLAYFVTPKGKGQLRQTAEMFRMALRSFDESQK